MARKPRIHYEGALYHVICRGNNREPVLLDPKDKLKYFHLISKYKQTFYFRIFAWCLMDNHAHLLIEVGSVPLSKIMQGIQQSFTLYYNEKYCRTGHVFEQRYKAMIVDKERYLLALIRYIHNNPVRAGMSGGLDYRFSSHADYLRGRGFLTDIDFPLSLFGSEREAQITRYLDFMKEEVKSQPINISTMLDEIVLKQKNSPEGYGKFSPEDILMAVCHFYQVEMVQLKYKSNQPQVIEARHTAVILLNNYSSMTIRDIAEVLVISKSSVSKWLSH